MLIVLIALVVSAILFSGVTNVRGSNIDNGKKIFDEKCKGKPNVPSILIISQLSEKDITNKVRNGVQGTLMRPFSTDELSDSDLNDVIIYLKNSSSSEKKTSPNTSPTKVPGFDMNIGILGMLLIYVIYRIKN